MEIDSYIDEIGGSPIIKEKVHRLYELVEAIKPEGEEIRCFFISNFMEGDIPKYLNSWFFTDNFLLESKDFLLEGFKLDIIFYRYVINKFEFSIKNCNVLTEEYNESSRINLDGIIQNTLFEMSATGVNCQHLWHVIKEYMAPNLLSLVTEESEE